MRLPHGFHGPWTDADGGGAADLQTDVMRFMAILALCLVAIFALVQAIPVEKPPETASAATADAPAESAPVPVPDAAVPFPEPSVAEPAVPTPTAPVPVPKALAPVPKSAPPDAPQDRGYTLRFESDDALKSLVARNEVGLYAMQGDQAKRLHVARGRLEFWRASSPSMFHEMEAGTVPGDVVRALTRNDDGRTAVRWGVTLPPQLSREIDRRVAAGGNGSLLIAANGRLRQE